MNALKKKLIVIPIFSTLFYFSTCNKPNRSLEEVVQTNFTQTEIVDTLRYEQSYQRERMKELSDFQKTFNNVYKVVSVFDVVDKTTNMMKETASAGTAYNFVDEKGSSYYITAYHAIFGNLEKQSKLKKHYLFNNENKTIDDVVLAVCENKCDVAILKSKSDNFKAEPFKPIKASELIHGEDCYIIGYPSAEYRVIKKSNISSVIRNVDTGEVRIIMDEKATSGFSGGPFFVVRNGELRYAGMVNRLNDEKNVTMGVPYDYIFYVLSDGGFKNATK